MATKVSLFIIPLVIIVIGILCLPDYITLFGPESIETDQSHSVIMSHTLTKGLDTALHICSQQMRRERVKEKCKMFPHLDNEFDLENRDTFYRFRVNDVHNFLYCVVPKAASTTMNNLMYYSVTGEYLDDIHCLSCWQEKGLVWLKTLPPYAIQKRLDNQFKVMVVRHPFSRLVSCWINGFVVKTMLHGIYASDIVKRIRQIPKGSSLKRELNKQITFPEFVSYVIYLEESTPETHHQQWKPYSRFCHPCYIHFDLIVKVETLAYDATEVLKHLNLNTTAFPFLNANRQKEGEEPQFSQVVEEWRNISAVDQRKIKELYRYDMELFGYSWDDDKLLAHCRDLSDENSCC